VKKIGKWLGAGLGWTLGGPIGALLGFTFGTVLELPVMDNLEVKTRTTKGDFMISFMVLVAAIMKADRKVLKSELDFVKKQLLQRFGETYAKNLLKMLKNLLDQDIPLFDICTQIRESMDHAGRLQLLHLLFGIAVADGKIINIELEKLGYIASQLNISDAEFASVKNMFLPSTQWAYKVLEINNEAGIDEVKKAFRKQALKNHPDRVAYLGEDIRKQAHEKFNVIRDAYKAIKMEKGIA
jgi:DnaJ like chaperone protein